MTGSTPRRSFIVPLVFTFLQLLTGILADCPPVPERKDLTVECVLPHRNERLDCHRQLPQGAEVYYRCNRFLTGLQSDGGQMVCTVEGQLAKLSEYRQFKCVSECGEPGNATFETLSSFIEREHDTGELIFPWHAALFRRYGFTSNFRYTCGATLVNPANKGFFVLTAAHCVTKSPMMADVESLENFMVVLGAVSTEFEGNTGSAQIFKPRKIVIEKEYNPHNLQSNIAMIELGGSVRISETVQPACFPTRTIANFHVRPGGNGQIPKIHNDRLAYQEILTVPISEQGECLRGCARQPTNTEFCGLHRPESRLTPLDSGSGLVFGETVSNRKVYYLQGILTKVAGESDGCAVHDTFTSVSIFLDWMNQIHDSIADGQKVKEVTTKLPLVSSTPSSVRSTTQLPPPPPSNNIPQSPVAVQPPSNGFVGNEVMRLGLELHNYYRRMHQAPPVHINFKLSKEAHEWAEYLLHENKWEFSEGKDYSENIFQYFGKISENEVVQRAVDNWYKAIKKYNWNYPEASTFSQVVWRDTTEIGIGVATKGTKSVVVTNYWPKGNIYNSGEEDRGKYFRENVLPAVSVPDTVSLI